MGVAALLMNIVFNNVNFKIMDNVILLQSMFSTIGQWEMKVATTNQQPDDVPNTPSGVEILEEAYGPLLSGSTIVVDLQRLLQLIPKRRRRIDSYRPLMKQLHDEYGVNLIIKSRKTK